MKYDTIYFDLDGTLTDPGIGITNAVMYGLKQMGYPVPPRTELYKYIGPPLSDSFREYAGMTEDWEVQETIRQFRVYYNAQGKFENQVYDGIPQMLANLQEMGKHLILATSKPEHFARQILEHFDLLQYFEFIGGATEDERRTRKADVLAWAMEHGGRENAVMVGDREHDVLGARANDLPCIGVLFGYGDRPELERAGAARIAATVEELEAILEEE